MTETLKTLLHEQAGTVRFDLPDLDAITTAGDRQVRRRRGAGVVAGLAALAVVGGAVAVSLGGGGDDGDVQPVGRAAVTPRVTWATGTVLHTPVGDSDLGVAIRAYVRTAAGYVLTDGRGGVHSYVDGTVARVGTISEELPHLEADTDGSLVGWVDPTGAPTVVVLDLATGETRRFEGHEPALLPDGARGLDALDGRTAYWRDERGSVAVDVDSGAVRLLDEDGSGLGEVLAAEDGVLARSAPEGPGGSYDAATSGPVLQSEAGEIRLQGAFGSSVVFSPGARYVSVDADSPAVFDARTGDPVRLAVADRWFATGLEWLDDETLVTNSSQGRRAPYVLSTCTVPSGTCEDVADLGTERDWAETGLTVALGR